ncbi:LITAF domain-containing protein-like [Argopecten irradians]|uniref:LITAF domain-containing protein-like n=1 Tax=Argopecten irradians TaxID=31199 RepID=UPI0037185A7D
MAQPPPPPSYQPPGPAYQQTATVVVTNPQYVRPLIFRENPVSMSCPFCQAQIVTTTTYTTGTFAWVVCLLLLFFGLWLGCCLIPFCLNGCKDVLHHCPNCRQQVGKYSRM